MRFPALLFALSLAAVVAFGAAVSSQQARNSFTPASPSRNDAATPRDDTSRMWSRAEIRVIPQEQVEWNRAALESLRNRVAEAERHSSAFWLVDPDVRQQLSSQVQLMKQLLAFAELQQSNRGKSVNAIAVERRLNQLEGQTMCEACHGGIVAQNHGGGTLSAQ